MRDTFLVFGSPLIGDEEVMEMIDTLRSGWLGTGPKTHRFESQFAEYVGVQYAIGLNSCTAGLHLALDVVGVGPGDEVITTPITFASTANVIVHCGARPVFVDVDRETMNLSPALLEAAITTRTRAIMPVHMAGRPCDMDPILEVARQHGLVVIEDAAHAIEAWYKDRKVGNIGDMTAFSFYATKNVTTGEGGMLTTDRSDWAEAIRIRSLHGISKDAWKRYSAEGFQPYETLYPGYKYNMTDMQASLGIHQLAKVEENLRIRERHWCRYNEAFADIAELITPLDQKDIRHARHLYTILLRLEELTIDRNEFIVELKRRNIGSGIHFIAVHLHRYYREAFGFGRGDFPEAEWISDRTLSLPLSPKLTERDVEDVIEAVKDIVHRYRKPVHEGSEVRGCTPPVDRASAVMTDGH